MDCVQLPSPDSTLWKYSGYVVVVVAELSNSIKTTNLPIWPETFSLFLEFFLFI